MLAESLEWDDRRTLDIREGWLTANIGFSVANLDSFAESSFRRSGGKKRSRMPWPLLSRPPMLPCNTPVMPLKASAMIALG